MTYKVYKGSTLAKKIYYGSTEIKKVYKGSTLVWQADPYEPDTVLYESSTGGATATLSLEYGIYEVYCIAGGGGGNGRKILSGGSASGGGSGSGFIGEIVIPKGDYSISVGSGGNAGASGGQSNIDNLIITYGGSGTGTYPSGGAVPTINAEIKSTTLNSAGNTGYHDSSTSNYVPGGSSLYNGYGAGGSGHPRYSQPGVSGYIKIVYKGN